MAHASGPLARSPRGTRALPGGSLTARSFIRTGHTHTPASDHGVTRTGVRSQHLHPSLNSTEPVARTRAPGQAAAPGGAEGARGSALRYSLLLDALILATSFCTLGMSPFFTAWISSCSRPITDRWERQQRRRQRPSDPSCL